MIRVRSSKRVTANSASASGSARSVKRVSTSTSAISSARSTSANMKAEQSIQARANEARGHTTRSVRGRDQQVVNKVSARPRIALPQRVGMAGTDWQQVVSL